MIRSATGTARTLAMLLTGVLFAVGCVTGPPPHALHVLQAPPAVGYRTLGMVSGQGPNIPAATAHARQQAADMGADAMILGHQHQIAPNNWIVSVKAIKYLAAPEAQGPGGPGAVPAGPPQ